MRPTITSAGAIAGAGGEQASLLGGGGGGGGSPTPTDEAKQHIRTSSTKKEEFKPCVTPEKNVLGIPLRYIALACLLVQTTAAVILTRYSKIMRSPTDMPYHSTTLVVMAELSKFFLSILLIFLVDCSPVEMEPRGLGARVERFKDVIYSENLADPKKTLKVAVPAILYTIQNNLIYVALTNLEATTFQVGYQMKVITTAVLSVIMLNRRLSTKSWLSLLALTGGIIMTQVEGSKKGTDRGVEQNFALGLASVVTCGFCSAFAGVYFEKILKGTNPSLWVRNSQLACFSVLCGMLTMVFSDGMLSPSQFFEGYDSMVWLIIMVQAAGGLIVAVVVKYADNIMKGFAAALSIVLCGLMSVQLFAFAPSFSFVGGSAIVIGATFLYSTPDAAPPLSSPTSHHNPSVSHSCQTSPTVVKTYA